MPRPRVIERSSVAYEKSSACGTWAWTTCSPSGGVHPEDPPATRVEVAVDVAHVLLGDADLDAMIGSSSAGLQSMTPFFRAIEAAILNDSSFESTVWNEPS